MKNFVLMSGIILIVVFVHGVSFSQQVVTSKELQVSDVEKAIMSGKLKVAKDQGTGWSLSQIVPGSIKILGVYQEANQAKVFYSFEFIPDLARSLESNPVGSTTLIRFTNGQWYSPGDKSFLYK